MFTASKVDGVTLSVMDPKDAAKWSDAGPPSLTLVAHSRGADHLYTYMRGFCRDPVRPNSWDDIVFDEVGMPHPLWEQQGIRAVELDTEGQSVMVKDERGNLTPKLY